MTSFLWGYLIFWLLFCSLVLVRFIRQPGAYSLTSRTYCQQLQVPWKMLTFIIATCSFVFIAPYTGDPTWDYVDGLFMSVLTYLTAPWSVGILYRSVRQLRFSQETLLAICLWLFSASWSYDGYLLWRDGHYPATWYSNIVASSVLYCSAGLLWSLDWVEGRGMTFAFLEKNWPSPQRTTVPFRKVFWCAAPFIVLVGVIVLSFVS